MKRKITRKINVATQVLLMVCIMVVINFMASRHFVRADFTAGREYTLAEASRNLLKNLEDIVTINVYISRKLPPYMTNLKRDIYDLLDEYRAFGGNNIKIRSIFPDDDPAAEQKMRSMGIPQVQVNILEKDQFQSTYIYMGMAVLYENKKELIPFVQDVGDLEYRLTSSLLKVTREETIRISMAYDEDPMNSMTQQGGRYSLIERELDRQYDYSVYRFTDDAPVPKNISCLVVAGKKDMTDRDLYRLDQFLTGGGKLILLVDNVELVENSVMGRRVEHKLDRLLNGWGLEVRPEVVVDPRYNAPASFTGGFFPFRIDYPFWPDVPVDGFENNHPIVSQLESMVMPWTSAVSVTEKEEDYQNLEYIVLANSSPYSWSQGEPFNFSPQKLQVLDSEMKGTQPLAVLVTGTFRSIYKEDSMPDGLSDDEKSLFRIEGPETSVIIAGNSRFIQNDFLRQFPENGLFFMNAIDWMAQSQGLIGIRSRGNTKRPLPEMSERAKAGIRLLNIFVVSGLIVLTGATRLYLRRKLIARTL